MTKPIILGIAGGTGAGKTTLAKAGKDHDMLRSKIFAGFDSSDLFRFS